MSSNGIYRISSYMESPASIMKSSFALLLLIIFLTSGNGFSQNSISVESKLDRAEILIGDVVKYSLIITHDSDVQIQTPTLAANLGQFEIRDYKVLEPSKKGSQIIAQTDYLISTFDTGDYEIPALEIGYSIKDDTTLYSIKTEPIRIKVASLNPDEAGDIRDIKPPLEIPRDWKRLFMQIGGIVLACIAVTVLFIYLRRRKQGLSILPRRSKPQRPAHEIALEALDQLTASDLLTTGQVKEYFCVISDIVRQYIENRFSIYSLEMTTTQLLENMQAEQLDQTYIDMMRDFLPGCDLVKFAKYLPSTQEIEQITRMAYNFVHKTKLVIIDTDTAAGTAASPIKTPEEEAEQAAAVTLQEEGR